MMNLLALGLVVSTLTAAGVLTPPVNPPHLSYHQTASDQVLREGHRVIVLEYERQIPAGAGTGTTGTSEGDGSVKALSESTKDKICDAFGVCRDKLSGAASDVEHAVKGAKDKLSGILHHGKDKLPDTEEMAKSAKDKVSEAKDAVKDKLFQTKEETKDKVSDAKDEAKDKLSQAMDATKDKLSQAKEVTKDKLSQTKEVAEEKVSEAKEKMEDKFSNAENKLFQAKEKTKEKFSEMEEEAKDKASHIKEGIKATKEKAGNIAEQTAQNLTDIARRARDVAYDMASYVASPRTSRAVWAVVHLLGFTMAYGTSVWVTFVSSHVLASALPRQQFGVVQSKVYPVYFRVVAYGVGLAFLAQFFGRDRGRMLEKLQAYNLLGAFGLVLANLFFLEPNATKVMFERMKAHKEEGRGLDMPDMVEPVATATAPTVTGLTSVTTTTTTTTAAPIGSFDTTKSTSRTEVDHDQTAEELKLKSLSIRLRRWNSYSSVVNVLTLVALTWHLVHLARLISCCD